MACLPFADARDVFADAGYVGADVTDVSTHVSADIVDASVQELLHGVQVLASSGAVLCYGDAGTPQKSGRSAEPGCDNERRSRDQSNQHFRAHVSRPP
ncbi:hypothetical protein OTB20_08395 [Streptomyces sp. H27-H1]|uniref:hypothetical protein n=1 Tax=Streptomyces sp. H27-H1 TaxID=2996461 RepID=UPI00226ED04D|nr:hypothetical protein [Streptomyces sp. H27-H1]MCY0926224.1 hypothetical protein [Streptomyces sp. H27-H1]